MSWPRRRKGEQVSLLLLLLPEVKVVLVLA